ncbi:small VCP/p97-interacting protein, partial [Egretta garzetta]|uniref:small VCP/p97-interacting protein n=1 Tax=Egretta garzetta TaxID=188379 RepID=UPI00163B885F
PWRAVLPAPSQPARAGVSPARAGTHRRACAPLASGLGGGEEEAPTRPARGRELSPFQSATGRLARCLPSHASLGFFCSEGVMQTAEYRFLEIKRRQLAEAAEKRQMEASSRGIKNAYSVEQKKKKQEEMEKRIAASGSGGEGGLRWQVG